MHVRLKTYLASNNPQADKKLFIMTLVYLAVLSLGRWGLRPTLDICFFVAGGLVGVHFLDLADALFALSPSPFKNVLFQAIFVFFTFFVLTSSGSLFGTGLVLSIFLSMLYCQWQEYRRTGSLASWFWIIKREITPRNQQIYFAAMVGLFLFLSLLFV